MKLVVELRTLYKHLFTVKIKLYIQPACPIPEYSIAGDVCRDFFVYCNICINLRAIMKKNKNKKTI